MPRCTRRTPSARNALPDSGAGGGQAGLRHAGSQQLFEFSARQRLAVKETLIVIAAERLQETQLRQMLDALGDHFQVQAVREGDDRLDDYGVVLVA